LQLALRLLTVILLLVASVVAAKLIWLMVVAFRLLRAPLPIETLASACRPLANLSKLLLIPDSKRSLWSPLLIVLVFSITESKRSWWSPLFIVVAVVPLVTVLALATALNPAASLLRALAAVGRRETRGAERLLPRARSVLLLAALPLHLRWRSRGFPARPPRSSRRSTAYTVRMGSRPLWPDLTFVGLRRTVPLLAELARAFDMLAFLLKSVVLLLHLCGLGPAKLGRSVLLFVELLLTFRMRVSFLTLVVVHRSLIFLGLVTALATMDLLFAVVLVELKRVALVLRAVPLQMILVLVILCPCSRLARRLR